MVICLTLFVLMMVSLAMNKVPMGVTGLATLAALVIFKCIEAKDALSCFGNANVIIIVGMFVVGAGLRKTTLIGKITEFIRKVTGGNFKFAYRGVIILAILLTSILKLARQYVSRLYSRLWIPFVMNLVSVDLKYIFH